MSDYDTQLEKLREEHEAHERDYEREAMLCDETEDERKCPREEQVRRCQ